MFANVSIKKVPELKVKYAEMWQIPYCGIFVFENNPDSGHYYIVIHPSDAADIVTPVKNTVLLVNEKLNFLEPLRFSLDNLRDSIMMEVKVKINITFDPVYHNKKLASGEFNYV